LGYSGRVDYLRSVSFVLPGAVIAALCMQAAVSMSAIYVNLRLKAAEQERSVPPLAAAYFRNTVRVLFVGGILFLALASADAVTHLTAPNPVLARVFGYGSGLALIVCSFALILHGGVDRHLKLLSRLTRRAYPPAGGFGVGIAAWGMVLVTMHGGVWA
jgi:hypothetical protein